LKSKRASCSFQDSSIQWHVIAEVVSLNFKM
jgi:hypothetical protein